jgi:Domain of unknown function (DUF5658)
MAGTESERVRGEVTERAEDPADRSIPVRRWYLVATLVMLNLLDVLTTRWILDHGGSEQNPILRPIIHDPLAPLLIKLGLCLVIGSLVLAAPRRSWFADAGLVTIVAVYTCVIGWNVAVLLQAATR